MAAASSRRGRESSGRTTRESSAAPMCRGRAGRSLPPMTRKLLFILIVTGLILLALGGWTIDGLRWALGGGSGSGAAPAPA